MKIFFDVDGVLIDGWHSKPERRRPWDATIEQDLGIDREGLRQRLFTASPGGAEAPMLACACGRRDLKEVLAEILPAIGYRGSVDAFVGYWFEKDANVNRDLFAVVERLARHRVPPGAIAKARKCHGHRIPRSQAG